MQLLHFYTGDTLTHVIVIEEDTSSNDDAGLLTCYISTSHFYYNNYCSTDSYFTDNEDWDLY